MEYVAGWNLSAGEALLLMVVLFGIPAAIIAAIIGAGITVKNKIVDSSSDDIPYNPAYNLKQEQPEVKQFVPHLEQAKRRSAYGPLKIGLIILAAMIGLYLLLVIVMYGL